MKTLTLKGILLYSSASMGLNIVSLTAGTWLPYFCALPPDSGRIQYLPVTLVGVVLTVTSLWDAIIDPIIGHWSDTTRSRWGKRRPFLMFGAPAMALALAALILPQILQRFGYTTANPLGARLAWLATGAMALLGAVTYASFRLDETPEETRSNMGLESTTG